MMLQDKTTKHWNALQDSLGGILRPIETPEHYDQLAVLLDDLLEATRDDPHHPLRGLLDLVTRLIQDFDALKPLELSSPSQMLNWYMKQAKINQIQLASSTGLDQSLISKHLLGKRRIGVNHAQVYAAFFSAPLAAFVPELRN
jgi:antitoxin component HigA of HigAB toxin-antitoxin module